MTILVACASHGIASTSQPPFVFACFLVLEFLVIPTGIFAMSTVFVSLLEPLKKKKKNARQFGQDRNALGL